MTPGSSPADSVQGELVEMRGQKDKGQTDR